MFESESNRKSVFVIDDEEVVRMSSKRALKKTNILVETFEDGEEGLKRIEEQSPDLVLVDLKMPKMGGLEVITRVREIDPEICVIVITGFATVETAVDAMRAGAYDFLPKPFSPAELRMLVNRGLERTELMRKTRLLLEEKEKMKRSFITFVSHQLQSPLAAALQYLDILRHMEDSPEKAKLQDEWIERAANRVREMINIIRDWMTLAKIESRSLQQNRSKVLLPELIKEVFDTIRDEALARDIELKSETPENCCEIEISREGLYMVLSNLVTNAFKYSNSGGNITVNASGSDNNLILTVSDTGFGIPEELLPLIFNEYYRVKDERNKDIPGTGMGLPICKKLTTEMGGTIAVESRLNEGTTFTLTLPLKAQQEENPEDA